MIRENAAGDKLRDMCDGFGPGDKLLCVMSMDADGDFCGDGDVGRENARR